MGITGLEKASESLQTVVALQASDIGNLKDGVASLTVLPEGDGPDALRRFLREGPVDVVTAGYLAEANIGMAGAGAAPGRLQGLGAWISSPARRGFGADGEGEGHPADPQRGCPERPSPGGGHPFAVAIVHC